MDDACIRQLQENWKGQTIDYREQKDLYLPLPGGHQAINAAVALETLDSLRKQGLTIPEGAIQEGFKKVQWFGRFTCLTESPWFFIDGDKPDQKIGNYEHFAGCKYMPKLNTNTPAVQDYLISVGRYWVEKYGIDGWRLDVADEVSDVFWRRFRIELKRDHPDLLLIAENWHDAYPWLRGDEYDGVMNYSLTKACLDYLVYGVFDAQAMADRLSHILMRNTDQVNNMMLDLLDSHDTERFLTLAKKSGKDERSLLCALAILFFSPGMPCIYYGTEIGMEGGYDPDCRRTFDWNRQNWNMRVYDTVKKLIRLRKRIAGEVKYSAQDGVLLIERKDLLLAVNNGTEKRATEIAGRKYEIDPFGFKIINIKDGGVL